MKNYSIFIAFAPLLVSCTPKNTITRASDYNQYLDAGHIGEISENINRELLFWKERLQKDTGSYINMLELARYHLERFKLTGNFQDLSRGDSLLQRSSAKLNDSDPEILFRLSQNSITLHRFRQAAFYNEVAERSDGDRYVVHLLEFDTRMELGQFADARKSLERLKDKAGFDYLLRKAKWEDHCGNLPAAIEMMNQALGKVATEKSGHYIWALSNLADMYGHAGRIRKSYEAYLEVLKHDPANLHSLKGIAWIAYAHDHNPAAAKRILQYILSQSAMPEIKLLLAEMAGYANQPDEKRKWTDAFLADMSEPGYGSMYNKYLIRIYGDEGKDPHKALSIAGQELQERFTPETAGWFAWAQYQAGRWEEAYQTAKAFVRGFTHEPDVLLHTAIIYAAAGRIEEAKKMLEECLGSSFELGPVATRVIKEKLASL